VTNFIATNKATTFTLVTAVVCLNILKALINERAWRHSTWSHFAAQFESAVTGVMARFSNSWPVYLLQAG